MSRASKVTLATTSLMAAGIVVFVHYAQQAEKAVRQQNRPSGSTTYSLILAFRQCMRESFEISNSNASRRSVKQTSKCNGRWSRSTKRCRASLTEMEPEIEIGMSGAERRFHETAP